MALLAALGMSILLLLGCGATYTNAAKVETNWIGQVTHVEGGTEVRTPLGASPLDGILHALWSFTGLICVGLLLLALVAWRVPAVRHLLTFKKLRDRRRANRSP